MAGEPDRRKGDTATIERREERPEPIGMFVEDEEVEIHGGRSYSFVRLT